MALQEAFVVTGIDYYLIGAQARNIWYKKVGYEPRRTQDVDFIVMVPGGERYLALQQHLSEHSNFTKGANEFVMESPDGQNVDIIPFDEMNMHGSEQGLVNGLTEVYDYGTELIENETGQQFKIATLPAIIALKLIAFDDRPEYRDKDPGDIAGILRAYFHIETERIYQEHADLFTREYLELEDCAAIVIGREIRKMGDQNQPWLERLRSIIDRHISEAHRSSFVRMMIGRSDETVVQQVDRLKRLREGLTDDARSFTTTGSILLALKGKYESGKTTTIRLFYHTLMEKGFKLEKLLHGNPENPNEKGDFAAILIRGDTRIGITSVGDTFDLLAGRLAELHDHKCNIYICACRSFDRGRGTNAAIAEFSERYHCRVLSLAKERVQDVDKQQAANLADTQTLWDMLLENGIAEK